MNKPEQLERLSGLLKKTLRPYIVVVFAWVFAGSLLFLAKNRPVVDDSLAAAQTNKSRLQYVATIAPNEVLAAEFSHFGVPITSNAVNLAAKEADWRSVLAGIVPQDELAARAKYYIAQHAISVSATEETLVIKFTDFDDQRNAEVFSAFLSRLNATYRGLGLALLKRMKAAETVSLAGSNWTSRDLSDYVGKLGYHDIFLKEDLSTTSIPVPPQPSKAIGYFMMVVLAAFVGGISSSIVAFFVRHRKDLFVRES